MAGSYAARACLAFSPGGATGVDSGRSAIGGEDAAA